jgi:Transposase DDE domain
VEAVAPEALGSFGRSRPDRLGEGFFGLSERCCPRGGQKTGLKNPTDKGKRGSKRHVVVDRKGVPLAVIRSAANAHDSKALEEAMDAISPIQQASWTTGQAPEEAARRQGLRLPSLLSQDA